MIRTPRLAEPFRQQAAHAIDRFINRSIDVQVAGSVALITALTLMLFRFVRPNILGVQIPNVMTMGALMLMALLIYCGYAGLRRTAFDVVLFFWMLLAIASHMYASIVLKRYMFEQYLLLYLVFLLSVWMMFRVSYAATIVRPRKAIIAFNVTAIAVIMLAGIVQILQNNGPVTQQASDFATFFLGSNQEFLDRLASEDNRPSAWYGGPNIAAFFMCIAIAMLSSIVIVYTRVLNWRQTIAAGLGILFAGFVCINAQSRSSVAVAFGLSLLVLIVLMRRNQYGKVMVFVSMTTALVSSVLVLGAGRFGYLLSIFESGARNDGSFVVRNQFFGDWLRVANEAAVLGTGVSQVNNRALLGIAGYDYYYVAGIDNEWANIYQAHGILGVIFMAALGGYAVRLALKLGKRPESLVRLVAWQLGLITVVYFTSSLFAVRIGKMDTVGIFAIVLGIASALQRIPASEQVPECA